MRKYGDIVTFVVIASAVVLAGCSGDQSVQPNSGTTGQGNPAEEVIAFKGAPSAYGNCLSMPVVFAEDHGLTGVDPQTQSGLRGTPGIETFIQPYDETTVIDGFPVYQNPSVNEWQADWAYGSAWAGEVPVELDWSDNVVRQTWTDRSKVRVEVILTTPLDGAASPLYGYNMYSLGGSSLQEVFVTNTVKYSAATATVYSNVARLKIEKLDTPGGVPVNTIYNSACYERYFVDGPSNAYSAEVNMGGKCIYGFNWDIGASALAVKSGWYRLTFSLDPSAAYADVDGEFYTYPRSTIITGLNPADLAGLVEPDVVLYPPTLSPNGHSSELEIYVRPKGSRK